MNILFLSDDFPPQSFGGAGIVAFNLARALCDAGHTVTVITTVQDRGKEGVVTHAGLRIHQIFSRYHERWRAYVCLYNPQTVAKVRDIIEEIRPDVIHAHNVHHHLSYHCLKLAKESGAQVFLTAHDVMLFHYGKLMSFVDPQDHSIPTTFNYRVSPWRQFREYRLRYNPFRNLIIKRYLRYVDRICAVSDALKEALNQNGVGNVEVMHNGIDVADWGASPEDVASFKKKHDLFGKKVVLFGGRLSEAKGGHQAIRALREVVAKIPDAVLLFMGDISPYMEQALRLADRQGVREHILFTGWLSGGALKAAYACADVVLVPSLYLDPFPTINLEAMASKKPVVGTCFGGTPEILVDGETGYIVNPYDERALAERTIAVLTSRTLSDNMGGRGHERVMTQFSASMHVQNILSLYDNHDEQG